jgi:hypothetical protein
MSYYDEKLFNIYILNAGDSVHYSNLTCDLQIDQMRLSFPQKSVQVLKLHANFLISIPLVRMVALLDSIKTWLSIETKAFLQVECMPEQHEFLEDLFGAVGFAGVYDKGQGAFIVKPVAFDFNILKRLLTKYIKNDKANVSEFIEYMKRFCEIWRAKVPRNDGLGMRPTETIVATHLATPFVSVQLWGGLGNQLYLYAFAKSIAKRWGTDVVLDASWFNITPEGITPREYKLKYFNIRQNFMLKQQLAKIVEADINAGSWQDSYEYPSRPFLSEQYGRCFDPCIMNMKVQPIYIMGYWQSYKYFEGIKSDLLEDLKIIALPSRDILQYMNLIKSTHNSVALHIRRGDYLLLGQGNVLSLEYYKRAIALITAKIANPTFFVFSDDMNWVKENLQLGYPTYYVDSNTEKNDYDDLRLMSMCNHQIIANSTFSWWGAWLNQYNDKIVVAPTYGKMDKDLYPPKWNIL